MLSYPRFTSIPCFVEALKSGEASIADMVEEYNRRRLVMVKGLNDIGLSCFEPRGAFYLPLNKKHRYDLREIY